MNKELHKTLLENEVFKLLLEDLKKSRPIIAQYDWKHDNIAEVRANLLIQQGYDRALQIINPFNGEQK